MLCNTPLPQASTHISSSGSESVTETVTIPWCARCSDPDCEELKRLRDVGVASAEACLDWAYVDDALGLEVRFDWRDTDGDGVTYGIGMSTERVAPDG